MIAVVENGFSIGHTLVKYINNCITFTNVKNNNVTRIYECAVINTCYYMSHEISINRFN